MEWLYLCAYRYSSGSGNDDSGGNTIPTDPLEVATEAQK